VGYYDAYNAILSVTITPRDRNVDITKRAITSTFKNSPSYYQVQVNTASTPLTSTPIDLWIVDDPSKVKEIKQIQLIPDVQLNYGDIINWLGDYWLTTTVDYMGDIYYRGSMQKCYSSLKWKDSKGKTIESYFTVTKDAQRGLGILDGKEMILANERRFIAIQNNVDTLKIIKGQRFIFDNGRCWRTTSIDTLSTGLIQLELEETPLNNTIDNVELRIANYYLHNYTVEITNGTSVNLNTLGTLQLNVTTKDNGVITDLPITYTTTDNTIATVDSTGIITCVANGTVNIKAALTNDPTVYSIINVVVSDVVTSGWTLDISGNDYCEISRIQKFVGEVKNNGVTDTSKLIRWTLYDDSGLVPTTLGEIISQSGHDVSIRANNKYTGHVKIKGACYEESNFTVEDLTIYSVEELAMKTLDELFGLGMTVDEMATFTIADLANRTVGDLSDETVLVSNVMRVRIKSLL
jgi:hypothetical protein